MENKNSLLVQPFLKSLLPLIVGGSFHLFKEIFKNFSQIGSSLNSDDLKEKLEAQEGNRMSSEEMPSDFFSLLNHISFGIYSNFFAFMLVMLLIDVFFKIIHLGVKMFWKNAKSSLMSFNYSMKRRKGACSILENQMMMRILSYALIFISLQIAGLCLSFVQSQTFKTHHDPILAMKDSQDLENFSPQIKTNDDQGNYFGLPRILSEEQDNELVSMMPSSDKISLSMGNILGSLNLDVNTIVLSKDRKIAYVTLDLYGTLKVIDISDLQSPFVIGTLNLEASSYYGYRIKNLLLSSDEKTLYASNSRDLEIIDVRDPRSPRLISLTKSQVFLKKMSGNYQNSLVIQERTKTLFIGGMGLQVYDISDPKMPLLLKTVTDDNLGRGAPVSNEICMSGDEQILFVANGTLDIYNISNPKKMKLLHSFTTESYPRTLSLSEDFRTAYLLGAPDENFEMIFEEVDISNYKAPKVQNTIKLVGYKSKTSPHFLAVLPNKSKFFIFANLEDGNEDLLIFDRVKQTIIKNEKSLIEDTIALNFSPDGRTLITASNSQFLTIDLFFDYPNRRIFSESEDNLRSIFGISSTCSHMQISDDEKYLFIVRRQSENGSAYVSFFEIWHTREQRLLSSHKMDKLITQMHLTKNYAYLLGSTCIIMLDIKDPSFVNVKNSFSTLNKKEIFRSFTTSLDEKAGFLLCSKEGFGYLSAFDLDLLSPKENSVRLDIQFRGSENDNNLLVKDDKILMILNQGMFLIFDISDVGSIAHIVSLPYGLNEQDPDFGSAVLTPDKKTLFLETSDNSGFHKLRVYDLSISASPQIISEKYFSKRERLVNKPKFSLSPDLKSGFIFQGNSSLIKLNITIPKEIKVSGIISLSRNKTERVNSYVVSPDGQTIYANIGNEIRVVNMNIKYSLFLKQERFLLGEKYAGKVSMLNLAGTSSSDYNLVESESYRITKLSLLDIHVAPNKYSLDVTTSLLPSWITFDSSSDSLTVEAKKQHDIGTYTFHAAFSLKIPKDIFKDMPVPSRDLWAWLISLDYVDPQLFLTDNFGSEDDFFLPEKFENHTKEIYGILKQFYFETCTAFEIIPSLKFNALWIEYIKIENKILYPSLFFDTSSQFSTGILYSQRVKETNRVAISTLSTNNIKVEIHLESQNLSDVKFVSRPYGSLLPILKDNSKTKISLEGTEKEINTALNSIVVNFENGTFCDADIIINDGFNPPVSIELMNISRFFKANNPPRLNCKADKTVQEQINYANIQTGVYFTFPFSEDTFEDDFAAQGLNYELKMAENNTAFPNWLNFNGLTLKGTPPEEVLGRDLELVLIAKNEFKQYGVPFKLHIKISAVFGFKVVLRYSPYILTLIGLIVSANKIFNILRKGFYKHGKEFYISVGEEISESVIFPISFIKEEQKQSQLILRELLKKGGFSIKNFIDKDRQVIEKEKIISAIKEVIQNMPRKQIALYPSPIIDQIIINKFVWMQLDSKEEIETKQLFKELEPDCLEVVERNASGFTINQNKLIQRIQKSHLEKKTTLEESLIGEFDVPEGVNIHLLKDAILAFAFENHSIDISPLRVDIAIKQKVPSNFLWRFLKLDLKEIHLNEKSKMDYGINYGISNDKLYFNGTVEDYFKGKTLVVQVKNRHQRIMKEIWIHGVSNNLQKDESFILKGEQEMRGQGYEIY